MQALKTGQAVTVVIDNRRYPAALSSIGMEADTGAGDTTVLVVAVFETGLEDGFRAGQAATLRLP